MLDKLPSYVRHLLIALAGALLTWGTESVKSVHLSPAIASLVGSVLTVAALVITPLTKQYGIAEINKTPKTPAA